MEKTWLIAGDGPSGGSLLGLLAGRTKCSTSPVDEHERPGAPCYERLLVLQAIFVLFLHLRLALLGVLAHMPGDIWVGLDRPLLCTETFEDAQRQRQSNYNVNERFAMLQVPCCCQSLRARTALPLETAASAAHQHLETGKQHTQAGQENACWSDGDVQE